MKVSFKRLIYYFGPIFLGLVITIILSKIGNASAHNRGQIIILFKEIETYFTIGFLWYAPFLFFFFMHKPLNMNERISVYITSIILCIIYYRYLTSFRDATDDTRLVAGYLYKYEYYLDVFVGLFLSILISGVFIEFKKRRTNTSG